MVPTDRTRSYGHKLKHRRFPLSTRKKFTVRVIKHRLSREAVVSPPLGAPLFQSKQSQLSALLHKRDAPDPLLSSQPFPSTTTLCLNMGHSNQVSDNSYAGLSVFERSTYILIFREQLQSCPPREKFPFGKWILCPSSVPAFSTTSIPLVIRIY